MEQMIVEATQKDAWTIVSRLLDCSPSLLHWTDLDTGDSLMHVAVRHSAKHTVKLLQERGLDSNLKNSEGCTADEAYMMWSGLLTSQSFPLTYEAPAATLNTTPHYSLSPLEQLSSDLLTPILLQLSLRDVLHLSGELLGARWRLRAGGSVQ